MTHYFFTKEHRKLYEELHVAIGKDKDLSSILNSQEYKEEEKVLRCFFQSELGSMLCYAITQHKIESAKSILERIESQESQKVFYSELAKELFKICNENEQNAKTIINFAKEHKILEHLFTDLPDERIRTELSRKDCNNEYVHSADTIVKTLKQKHVHKCIKHIYYNKEFRASMVIISLIPIILGFFALAGNAQDPSDNKAILIGFGSLSLIFFGLAVTFALCAGTVSSISNYLVEEKCKATLKELQIQNPATEKKTEDKQGNPGSNMLATAPNSVSFNSGNFVH